ncbi:protein-export chaperone SecB [Bacillus safensis]|uniref:protein-export chaperone SecB n=1 Tax=Bacillus safensis TaxID=561879 RepID=UPI000B67968B|nr:protein-export chaperone SecB [Bacillus safensis]UDB47310.1 protein-export chaperone SecB [Bacillus safensis]
MEMLEYYKIVKNSVQLEEVKLKSVKCEILDDKSKNRDLSLSIKRGVNVVSDTKAEIFMKATISFKEEAPFFIEVLYQGETRRLDENISHEDFEEYTYNSVVPLLLPYAREYVADLLSRMDFPVYTIPTIDILQTLKENSKEE